MNFILQLISNGLFFKLWAIRRILTEHFYFDNCHKQNENINPWHLSKFSMQFDSSNCQSNLYLQISVTVCHNFNYCLRTERCQMPNQAGMRLYRKTLFNFLTDVPKNIINVKLTDLIKQGNTHQNSDYVVFWEFIGDLLLLFSFHWYFCQ